MRHLGTIFLGGPQGMGGGLSKREGVPFRSFQSEARSFCCFFHRFAQIYVLITLSLLDIGFKWCFMTFFFCFERVLLAMRGCTFSLRGCSRTLKTPNSPPLPQGLVPPHLESFLQPCSLHKAAPVPYPNVRLHAKKLDCLRNRYLKIAPDCTFLPSAYHCPVGSRDQMHQGSVALKNRPLRGRIKRLI